MLLQKPLKIKTLKRFNKNNFEIRKNLINLKGLKNSKTDFFFVFFMNL
jgi:hypothetical protein